MLCRSFSGSLDAMAVIGVALNEPCGRVNWWFGEFFIGCSYVVFKGVRYFGQSFFKLIGIFT